MPKLDPTILAFLKSNTGAAWSVLGKLACALDLAWFSFERYYVDGQCYLFTTNPAVYEHHFDCGNPLEFLHEQEAIRNNIYKFFRYRGERMPDRFKDETEVFGHGWTLTIVRYYNEHYDVYHLASASSQESALNRFLANLSDIDVFIFDFLSKNYRNLDNPDRYFLLPSVMRVEHVKPKYKAKQGAYLRSGSKTTLISARQVEVLVLYALGKSHKQIGRILGISPSTVQTHLDKLKDTLGIDNRKRLRQVALANGLV